MTCNFLFVEGEKVGLYCDQPSIYVEGRKQRCATCINLSWPKTIYTATCCGANTRFSDKMCCRHRGKKTRQETIPPAPVALETQTDEIILFQPCQETGEIIYFQPCLV